MIRNLLLVAAILALVVAVPARADLLIDITVANPNLASQGSGPYAQYDVKNNCATDATACTSFTVVVNYLNNFVGGDGGIFALNLSSSAGAGTLGSYSATCLAGSTNALCPIGSPANTNEDGFGSMNFKLDDGAGFSDYFTALTINFTTANAVTLANLLTGNSSGAYAAGHFALLSNLACTGFGANTGATQPTGSPDNAACVPGGVPEPTSILLLGTALAFAGKFLRAYVAA